MQRGEKCVMRSLSLLAELGDRCCLGVKDMVRLRRVEEQPILLPIFRRQKPN